MLSLLARQGYLHFLCAESLFVNQDFLHISYFLVCLLHCAVTAFGVGLAVLGASCCFLRFGDNFLLLSHNSLAAGEGVHEQVSDM